MMNRYFVAAASMIALLALLHLLQRENRLTPVDRPNILLISIDTVRADHLRSYGHRRNTSPVIDRLAERGVLYSQAISQAPWTLPSMASMLTSLYPSQHGAVKARSAIPEKVETLAEALRKSGYATAGIVSHRFIDRKHGLAQGFQFFDESQIRGHDAVTSRDVTSVAIQHLKKLKNPFFMWIHYFDPHYTYVRHPDFQYASGYKGKLPDRLKIELLRKRTKWIKPHDLDYVKAVYDEEIAYTDDSIGKLLEYLESMRLDQSTVILLTADHGEYFLERGRFFHGKDVYRELIHVPLVISGAISSSFRGKTVDRPVEILSIPRTVMELTGISNHPFQGENLLTLVLKDTPKRFVFAEGSYALGTDERKATVIYDGWKLIRNFDDDRYELYNLSTDPQEKENLWEANRPAIEDRRSQLKGELDRFVQHKATETQEIEINEEEMEHLRSLGYVQ